MTYAIVQHARDSGTRRLYIRLTAVCPVSYAVYHACFVRVYMPSLFVYPPL